MENPLFSIITVARNPGAGLGQTVASVRAQESRDFEHIIKDAGSNDGSVDFYAKTSVGYAPIVICEPDGGIYEGMNQALERSRGSYVLFLNAGDSLYGADVLEKVGELVRRKPDLGLIYGDYFSDPLQMVVKSPKHISGFFLYRTMLCHQACFVKRTQIEKLGRFDTSFRVVADYDLLLRLVRGAGVSCYNLEKTLVSCRGGGFSSKLENARCAGREVKRIRRRDFRRNERLFYGCLRLVTLPQLRIKLMRSRRLKLLQRAYTRLANVWNSFGTERGRPQS